MLALAYVVAVLFFVLWLTNRRNPAQIIHEHKDLTQRIALEEEHLAIAQREGWGAANETSIRSNLEQLRARRRELERA